MLANLDQPMAPDAAAELVRVFTAADQPVMLWGPIGVGKSSVVRQTAQGLGWPMIDFRATLRDPVDLRGVPAADHAARRTVWFAPDELPRADRDGPHGILFLDEINAAHPQVQAALFGLVLDRVLGEYRLPTGWRIVAAGNRVTDRAAAQRMPTALRNRFAHISVRADLPAWRRWAGRSGIDPRLVAFLSFRPNLFTIDSVPDDRNAFPSPRTWAWCNPFLPLAPALRAPAVAALVGPKEAAELEGFLATYAGLPTYDAIVSSPDTAAIPPAGAGCWAVAAMLGRRAEYRHFSAVIRYAERLPSADYQMLAILDATRREPALASHPDYSAWCLRHPEIV